MPATRIQDTTGYLLTQVTRAYRARLCAALAPLGLYGGQESILLQLRLEDGQSQSRLAEGLCVEPPTVSKALDRMQKAGLVVRRQDRGDSRVSRVYLTDRGRELQQAVQACAAAIEERAVKGLNLEERLLLDRLLRQMHRDLS